MKTSATALIHALGFTIAMAVHASAPAKEVTIEHQGITLNARLARTEGWPRGPVVLMIHGTFAVADGERVKLFVIDGADHFFRDLYAEDLVEIVAEELAGLSRQ